MSKNSYCVCRNKTFWAEVSNIWDLDELIWLSRSKWVKIPIAYAAIKPFESKWASKNSYCVWHNKALSVKISSITTSRIKISDNIWDLDELIWLSRSKWVKILIAYAAIKPFESKWASKSSYYRKIGFKALPISGWLFSWFFFYRSCPCCFLIHKKYISRGWACRDKKRRGRQV